MKENHKKWLTLILSSSLVLGGAVVLPHQVAAQIDYVDSQVDEDQADAADQEDKEVIEDTQGMSQEDVNQAEGLSSEQIVVVVKEEGYITSHGDHYHYYNGPVPENAIYSEEIVAPEGYQFDEADVVYEIDQGYVVEVDGQYYIYSELGKDHPGYRTIQEIFLQSNGVHPEDAHQIVKLKEEYDLPEDSEIYYELERDLDTLLKDLQQDQPDEDLEPVLTYLTEQDYVALIGMDLYVLPGLPDEDIAISDLFVAPEDYEFDPDDQVMEWGNYKVVDIEGKHYLYHEEGIDSQDLTTIKKMVEKSHQAFLAHGKDKSDKKGTSATSVRHESGSRDQKGRYMTDDGYVFSPYDVLKDLGNGYIVPHGDHYHFIPKSDLSASEIAIADSVLRSGKTHSALAGSQSASHSNKNRQEGSQVGGRYTTDDGYVFTVESIVSADDLGLVAKHHEHFHYVPFKDLNAQELKAAKGYIRQHLGQQASDSANEATPKPAQPKPGDSTDSGDSKPDTSRPGSDYQSLLAQLYALPLSQRHVERDGLVFDPDQIIKAIRIGGQLAYRVPHGDHEHVILASDLSPLEAKLAQMKVNGQVSSSPSPADDPGQGANPTEPGKKPSKDDQPSQEDPKDPDQTKPAETGDFTPLDQRQGKPNSQIVYSPQEIAEAKRQGRYTTSDGYIFDAADISDYDGSGFTIPHMDHIHYVAKEDLNPQELKAALDFWQAKQGQPIDESENDHKDQVNKDFDPTTVIERTTQNGQVGYRYRSQGQEQFVAQKDLNQQKIAFAELQLNINQNYQYQYPIAPVGPGELEPGLYVPLSQLKFHAGSATYDTGSSFVIPHIDHIHIVRYEDISKEQIATIKYLMQHPQYRPKPWTSEGHDEEEETGEIRYVPNVTPLEDRAQLKNWQIIHSAEEVNAALAKGLYANDEGYIFDLSDLEDPATLVYPDGTFSIPKPAGSSYLALSLNQLPSHLQGPAKEILAKRQAAADKEKDQEPGVSQEQLIDFLMDHYQVERSAIRFQILDQTFQILLNDGQEIRLTQQEVLDAYQGKTQLPDRPQAESEPSSAATPDEEAESEPTSAETPDEQAGEDLAPESDHAEPAEELETSEEAADPAQDTDSLEGEDQATPDMPATAEETTEETAVN